MKPPGRLLLLDAPVTAPDTTSLLLPGGRRAEIGGDPIDRSVFQPIRQSGGEWEPHLRLLFERLVEPDWVCVDIGANIGVHSLTLAALATAGRVIAFEASDLNFRHLVENAGRLGEPRGEIVCVHHALWDRPGELELDEIDEFAGCSHITMTTDDGQAYLRSVIPAETLNGLGVHIHRRLVTAVRLDDWVQQQGLARLDLIKVDVEGGEARVLAGAANTLAKFQPLLVSEYHPGVSSSAFNTTPHAYFNMLRRGFGTIRVVEADGSLSAPLVGWEPLRQRIAAGKGWEDLLCEPRRGWLRRRVAAKR
jgi:FkbM family methyltransferase